MRAIPTGIALSFDEPQPGQLMNRATLRPSTVIVLLLTLLLSSIATARAASNTTSATESPLFRLQSATGVQLPSLQYALAGQYLFEEDEDYNDDSRCPAMPILKRVGGDALYAGKALISDLYHVYTSPSKITWKNGLIVAATFAAGYGIYTADQEIYDEVHRFKDDAWFKPIHEVGVFFEPMGTRSFTESWYFGGMYVGYIIGYAPLRDVSADILESIYLSAIVQAATKYGGGRLRPYQGDRTDWGKPKGVSFISGHTANMFQLAGVVSHHFPSLPVKIGSYTIATSVALERITSKAHWPSDVYFAALWGWFVTDQMFQLKAKRNFVMQPLLTDDGRGVMLGTVFTFDFPSH